MGLYLSRTSSARWVMMACVLLSVLLIAIPVQAANRWFDTNGTAAGGGNPVSGNISGGAFWSSSDEGLDPATWVAGDTAVFSAGSSGTTTATANSGITAAGIIVENGFVTLGGVSAITIGAGTVDIASGATFSTNNSSRVSATTGAIYTIHGGTLETTNTGAAGSFVDVDARIVLDGGGTLSHTAAGVLNIVQTNTTISGTGNLTKTGAGILAIASACTYTGDTIIDAGTLRMRTSSNRLPTGTNLIINSAGTFDPAVNQTVKTVNGAGKITFSGSGTLTINGGSGLSSVIDGVISDGSYYGKITKSGSGSLTLNAANTYDGTFTLSGGTCTVSSTGKLIGAVGDVVINGGTLNLNNAAQTIENLSGTGGIINLNGCTFVTEAAGDVTYAGSIRGDGSFTIGKAFKQTLTGTNTYTGGTTVSLGTLELGATGSIDGDVDVAAGAFLSLLNASALDTGCTLNLLGTPTAGAVNLGFTGAQKISAINIGGVAGAMGYYGAIGSGATYENAAFVGTGLIEIPEPSSIIALSCGVIGLLGLRRRRA